MLPEPRVWTREEMMKRVALFKDLKGNKGGLPDSHLPEAEKEIFNVIGFQPPEGGKRMRRDGQFAGWRRRGKVVGNPDLGGVQYGLCPV